MSVIRIAYHQIKCNKNFSVGSFHIPNDMTGGRLSETSRMINSWIEKGSGVESQSSLDNSFIDTKCLILSSNIHNTYLHGMRIKGKRIFKPEDIFTWIDKDHIILAIKNDIQFDKAGHVRIENFDSSAVKKVTYIGKYNYSKNIIDLVYCVSDKAAYNEWIDLNPYIRKII